MPIDPTSQRKSTDNSSSKCSLVRHMRNYRQTAQDYTKTSGPTIFSAKQKCTRINEFLTACVYVSLCVWSVAFTQVRTCREHMLFHLSHFEMLLLDELLISQNRTHEATHIIIGEAAVDGVIYCRVSCACVGEKDAMCTGVHLN